VGEKLEVREREREKLALSRTLFGERGKRPGDSRERAGLRAVSRFIFQHSIGAASCPYLVSVATGAAPLAHFFCASRSSEKSVRERGDEHRGK